jgi:hypothetical protein
MLAHRAHAGRLNYHHRIKYIPNFKLVMNEEYKVIMGNTREDYTIYYREIQNGKVIRKLAAATDIKFRKFRKPKVTLYLKSFQNWEVRESVLSFGEYIVVLKRIYDFLKSEGFEIDFDAQESVW